MKKFYQTAAIIALAAIIFGAAFSIAGICIGGTVEAAGELVEIHSVHGIHFRFPFFWFGSDEKTDELTEEPFTEQIEVVGEHELEIHYTEDIEELQWDISYASVTVLPGEEFAIWGDNLDLELLESEVTGNMWYLSYNAEERWGWNWKEGLEIPSIKEATLYITIPAGKVLRYASIELGAGESYIEGLGVLSADLELGVGDVTLQSVEILEEGSIEVGVGSLELQSVGGNNLDIECGMGDIKGSVYLNGDTDIDCGMGNVELAVAGQESDYNYDVSCGMGSIKLGDHHSYTGASDAKLENGSSDTIYLDCGVGTITLIYRDKE
ncbi:MAG: DUF4097 domain-containing protein [Lachnospiraceae bacterium]|jgi:hypothetical protein|nr:DUF4097 domain-containing protein [Lachnospiraceae bacterium]